MKPIKEIQKLCNGIEYNRDVPEQAKKIAEENNIIIIVGGSDDLMYCYGAKSYLTDNVEHSYGWDGEDLTKIKGEKKLKKEAKQLGLKIWWCGEIKDEGLKIKNYDTKKTVALATQLKIMLNI